MSCYAYVKLYQFDSDKKTLRAYDSLCVNYMKACFICNDWDEDLEDLDFGFPSKSFDAPEIETVGYASPELYEDLKKKLEAQSDTTYGKVIEIGEGFATVDDNYYLYGEENKSKFCALADAKKNGIPAGWVKIKRETYLGDKRWVNIRTLSDAFCSKVAKLEESLKKLEKLNALKESVEYYKLDDDARDRLLSDISCEEERRDDLKLEMSAFARLEGLLEGFNEKNDEDYTDITIGLLYIC